MAKVIFHPNIQGYNGQIINKVHTFRTRMKSVRGAEVGGIVNPKGLNSWDPESIPYKQYNLTKAFRITVDAWHLLTGVSKETWQNAALAISQTIDYNISGYILFVTYFQLKYSSTLGLLALPTSISAGVSGDYADRDSRIWA